MCSEQGRSSSPQVDLHLKTGRILSWKSQQGLINTSRNHGEHNSPCHAQRHVKTLSRKNKARREHDPESPSFSGPKLFDCGVFKKKKKKAFLWSEKLTF